MQDVLEKFSLISGLSIDDALTWSYVCQDAINEINSRLKPNTDTKANSERLSSAAACLSFYRYALYRASGKGMENFSVGDIKITGNNDSYVKNSYSIWVDAETSISDILEDKNFLFKQVNT